MLLAMRHGLLAHASCPVAFIISLWLRTGSTAFSGQMCARRVHAPAIKRAASSLPVITLTTPVPAMIRAQGAGMVCMTVMTAWQLHISPTGIFPALLRCPSGGVYALLMHPAHDLRRAGSDNARQSGRPAASQRDPGPANTRAPALRHPQRMEPDAQGLGGGGYPEQLRHAGHDLPPAHGAGQYDRYRHVPHA